MKKSVLLGLAAAAALGFTACNSSDCKSGAACSKGGDKEVLYSGIVPAADAIGTVYTLKLDFDDDHNYTDGDFTMVETSLVSDTISAAGIKDVASAYSKGDFRKASKVVDGTNVEYITLVPDAKDGLGAASTAPTYFIVNADGSLTMVNADLQRSATPELNYTLTPVK